MGFLKDNSSFLGGLANAGGNIASTLLTNKANKELAEYSFDMQRQMIQEQNAYNSPLQQIARYQEAGLNPSLIYGSGQASAGNQSSIAKYDAPHLQAPQVDLNSAIQMALQAKELQSRIKLQDEQAYAQRMLGLGYEQDAYSKQIDTAVKALNAGLKSPTGIWSNEELDQLRRGNALRRYSLETSGMETQQAMQKAQTYLTNLNAVEKDFVVKNILPLSLEAAQLNNQSKRYENIIKEIDARTEEFLRKTAAGSSSSRAFYGLGVRLADALRGLFK